MVAVWVKPGARSTGVGDRLVQAALGWARASGCGEVNLWVREGNGPAEDLYIRNGFATLGAMYPLNRIRRCARLK